MSRAPTARIVKGDIIERDTRCEINHGLHTTRILHRRFGIENAVETFGRREPNHALMQHIPQLSQRPVNFHAKHEDNQQHLKRHLTLNHPVSSHPKSRRCPHRNRAVGEATSERIGPEHPHRRSKQFTCLHGEDVSSRLALPECLQCR